MDSSYERALVKVGQNGKFQQRFDILYNVIFAGLWVMAYNCIILALTITPHICKLPDKPDNESEYSWKVKHIPTIEIGVGKNKFSECLMYTGHGNNDTIECNDYIYDRTWYETTVPSENNWVCDKELNVANIFAYSKIGEVMGSLIFGWLGDVYGRKPMYIISLAFLIIGRFISLLSSSSYIFFAFGCVVASFPSWSAVQSVAVISLEISSPKRRSQIAKYRLVASSVGMFIMPFLYWWLRSWKTFMFITTVTLLPYLLISGKIIESPQWLWVNRKFKTCCQKLKIISIINNTKLDSDTENEIMTSRAIESNKSEVLGPLALFSGLRLSCNTILQLLLWISVSINYTALLMSSGETSDGNPFLAFAWQSLAEIPGYLAAAWLADHIGRRYTGVSSCAITSLLWAIYCFRESGLSASWLKTGWFSSILLVTNRFFLTVSYYTINLFNMELYPTCLRQSGMSLGNVISGAASALAPYVLYMGRRFDSRYPGAILAVLSLLGGVISSLLLPETLNAKLPETMEDARNFGIRNHRYNLVHIYKKHNTKKNCSVNQQNDCNSIRNFNVVT